MKDNKRKPLSLLKFAHSKGISPYTFQNYVCKDEVKRRKVDVQAGRKSIVSANNTDFLADVFVRTDQANDGLTCQESISTLQDIDPKLTLIQAQRYFGRTFFKKNIIKVNKRLIKAQWTTVKRS